jgi:hypothetical protein
VVIITLFGGGVSLSKPNEPVVKKRDVLYIILIYKNFQNCRSRNSTCPFTISYNKNNTN